MAGATHNTHIVTTATSTYHTPKLGLCGAGGVAEEGGGDKWAIAKPCGRIKRAIKANQNNFKNSTNLNCKTTVNLWGRVMWGTKEEGMES